MNAAKPKLILTVVIALGALSPSPHAQSSGNTPQQFAGMWRLASWQERLADGTTRQNPRSAAYIIYTDTGHMCYVSMNPNRPKWKSATAPTESEALSGMGNAGFSAYCATVEVHAKEGFVLHHVELDKVPNSVGLIRKRWFTFQGPNRLSLRIDTPELTPPVVESTLVWERVEK
jgi:hypothetical protein